MRVSGLLCSSWIVSSRVVLEVNTPRPNVGLPHSASTHTRVENSPTQQYKHHRLQALQARLAHR